MPPFVANVALNPVFPFLAVYLVAACAWPMSRVINRTAVGELGDSLTLSLAHLQMRRNFRVGFTRFDLFKQVNSQVNSHIPIATVGNPNRRNPNLF